MTIQTVPVSATPGEALYTQTTTLEGSTFVLSFQYVQRVSSWYLSVADADGVGIANGLKLQCALPLLRKCVDPRRPAGDFIVTTSTTDDTPPGLLDLLPGSGRCTLMYITSDWIALLAAGQLSAILAQLASNSQAIPASTYGQR